MLEKKRRRLWMISFIVIALVIIFIFNFMNYYSLVERQPSDLWCKELKLGEGDPQIAPKIITEEDKVIALYGNEGKFIIKEYDLKGKELKSSEVPFDGEVIRKLCFLKDGDNYHIVYSHDNIEEKNMNYITLNSDLKETKREAFTGITDFFQYDSSNFLEYHGGKITWHDLRNQKTTKIPVDNVQYVLGATCGKKFFISYVQDWNIYGIVIDENGAMSETKTLCTQNETRLVTYESFIISGSEKNCYVAYDIMLKGAYADTRFLSYNFEKDRIRDGYFMVPGYEKMVYNYTGCNTNDGPRFFGSVQRLYIGKDVQTDILSFSMDEEECTEPKFASRMEDPSFSPYGEGDYMVFLNYNGSTYDVNLTSTNEAFRNAGKGIRLYDIKSSLSHTVSGFGTGISYMFVLGIYWVIPTLVVTSIGALYVCCKSYKAKTIFYAIASAVTLFFKLYFLKLAIYNGGAPGYPDLLSKNYMVFLVCMILTVLTYVINYVSYNESRDYVMMEKISCPLFLDSLFTCLVFLPVVP